ncbi:MAG: TOMM precursor leader peptide-binding protein, partial [Rhodothermales bacterium]|nr:TOMM precursor leader peptide-binding protein [Rhodothermales bacterium]
GRTVWLGPLFQPWEGACWACLAARLRQRQSAERLLRFKKGRDVDLEPPLVASPASLGIARHAAAAAVVDWIVRDEADRFVNTLRTLDPQTFSTGRHTVVQRPQCPACGVAIDGAEQPAHPVVLEPRKKTFTQDGGHRAVAPETTVERYRHHVSPVTGAVTRLRKVQTARPDLIHVYMAGQNAAFGSRRLEDLTDGTRRNASGKGATDVQARASALCEALERTSGIWQGDEPRCRARMADFGDAAIHPNAVMRFSERQYRERERITAEGTRHDRVPHPFDPEAELDWSPVWSLTQERHRYLPTGYLYYSYPFTGGVLSCLPDSNGNAAGNTLEEAVLQGFMELVERDAVAIWWYNRLRKPALALDRFDVPYVHRVRDFLREEGRDLWALDLTTDLGIPAFVSASRRTDGGPEHISLGFGAHLDARIALLRSVSELVQLANRGLEKGKERPHGKKDREEIEAWMQTATLENQPYLAPDPDAPLRGPDAFPDRWSDDLLDDVHLCRRIVEERGLEMLVLDQTRPDLGLPVVKVLVPGLRHYWTRFAPGRLYDV